MGPRFRRQAALGLGALFLAFAAASTAAAEVRAQVTGTQVDLDASAAPLPEVLDRLARLTGMKLVFDGAPPRPLVTISVHGRSPAQTVLAVLEGLGINYALISDATGTQVHTLLVTGTAAAASSAARSSSPALRANRNMPIAREPVDVPPENDEPPVDDGSIPGSEPGMVGAMPLDNPPDVPPAVTNPGAVPAPPGQQPQPYTPGPFLPAPPTTAQPLSYQPFPTPTPPAPPKEGQSPPAFQP